MAPCKARQLISNIRSRGPAARGPPSNAGASHRCVDPLDPPLSGEGTGLPDEPVDGPMSVRASRSLPPGMERWLGGLLVLVSLPPRPAGSGLPGAPLDGPMSLRDPCSTGPVLRDDSGGGLFLPWPAGSGLPDDPVDGPMSVLASESFWRWVCVPWVVPVVPLDPVCAMASGAPASKAAANSVLRTWLKRFMDFTFLVMGSDMPQKPYPPPGLSAVDPYRNEREPILRKRGQATHVEGAG